ncbi:hypothetical protein MYAER_2025 [Microcystis aeruginosa NIES-2549]|uniref:Uncharacterized protein n=1 Tax=Microcystis aeruginosa NIES-2549 TaxID=1641812 RepID=A0A0F6RLH8_MICAE|nr:hypothetical protein MYAER_2025 [Microcystis aeruginosa NIES-2549]
MDALGGFLAFSFPLSIDFNAGLDLIFVFNQQVVCSPLPPLKKGTSGAKSSSFQKIRV